MRGKRERRRREPSAHMERLERRLALVAPGTGWQMLWSDDFSGTALDSQKWSVVTGPRRDAVNSADAVKVANGALTLTTYTSDGTHRTGFVGSRNGFQATYGYWEARIKFEDSPGMWSAFWLQSPTIGTPLGDTATAGTEIDVVEHRVRDAAGRDISNTTGVALHWDGYGANHKSAGQVGLANPGPVPLQGNWHDYGVQWDPTGYRFFIDGRQVWSTTAAISKRSEFIWLSSEVQNGSWAGSIPAGGYGSLATSTTRMNVDWVRVWQKPISDVANMAISDGGSSAAVSFTVSQWSGAQTVVTAASSNPALLPAAAIVIEGTGANRTVRVNPVPGVGGTATVTLTADNGRVRGTDTFTVTVAPGSFTNGGFETVASTAWKPYQGATFVASGQRTGARGVRIAGYGGVEQVITGLLPNTTYVLGGWGRVTQAGVRNVVGAKNYGGAQATVNLAGVSWSQGFVEFTTSATNTSATIFVFKPTTAATGFFDDVTLRAKGPVPAAAMFAALAQANPLPTTSTTKRRGF